MVKNKNSMDDIKSDMLRLTLIMKDFNMNPIKLTGENNIVDRKIFCNILADSYPELRRGGEFQRGRTITTNKVLVSRYLGYAKNNSSNNALKFQLRNGAIEGIKHYKDYYKRYKIVKGLFENEELRLQIQKQLDIRDNAQKRATELMESLIK